MGAGGDTRGSYLLHRVSTVRADNSVAISRSAITVVVILILSRSGRSKNGNHHGNARGKVCRVSAFAD
jgi:hypothetical protein